MKEGYKKVITLARIQGEFYFSNTASYGVQFPAGVGYISLLHNVQTGSGAHPASYAMGMGSLSPGVKRPTRKTDLAPVPIAEVTIGGARPPLAHGSSRSSA
jgi:hypothetical protein